MLDWPADLPLPFAGAYAPFVRSLSGGQSLSGFEQVQPQLLDRWSASFSFHLGTDARVLALRSLLTRMRGRANTVLLPAFDHRRAPFVVTTGVPAAGTDIGDTVANPPFWRRWLNLAGTAYEFEALTGITGTATILADARIAFAMTGDAPVAGDYVTLNGVRREILETVDLGAAIGLRFAPFLTIAPSTAANTIGTTVAATVAAIAALNATTVRVTVSIGAAPQPGHLFSIGSRLYSIDTVSLVSGTTYDLGIWPWLRAAAAIGNIVNFTAPACEMRFASDDEGGDALRALGLKSQGDVTLRFDEAAAT